MTLHFYSPKAYNYVRSYFQNSLPHPKTLGKWYTAVDVKPGFQALAFLSMKSEKETEPIFCSLVFDKMAIRKHVEYDGENYHGYVHVGNNLQSEFVREATEVLVFMVVAINGRWKIPVGYFFSNCLNGDEKTRLVCQALQLLKDCNIIITNITFDGCPTNFVVCKNLGCSLDTNVGSQLPFSTKININSDTSCSIEMSDDSSSSTDSSSLTNVTDSDGQPSHPTFVMPDPSHMIKLVRNFFGERKKFLDHNGAIVDFRYIVMLNDLQESEGLHLANKLRRQHVDFFRQNIKVKLATQLLTSRLQKPCCTVGTTSNCLDFLVLELLQITF